MDFIKKINIWLKLPSNFKANYYTIKTLTGSIILKQNQEIIIKEIYILPDFREKGILKEIILFFESKKKVKIQSILSKILWDFLSKRITWVTVPGEYSMRSNINCR
jgi:hypothetical protein